LDLLSKNGVKEKCPTEELIGIPEPKRRLIIKESKEKGKKEKYKKQYQP
jgi:hypothetical protein